MLSVLDHATVLHVVHSNSSEVQRHASRTAPVAYPAVDLRGYSVSVVTEAHVRDSKDYESLPMHLRNPVATGHHDMSLESAQIVIHWSVYAP